MRMNADELLQHGAFLRRLAASLLRGDQEADDVVQQAYLKALEEAQRKRGEAALDAYLLFGVELVEGLPEDEVWVKKLRWLEKRKQLNLEGFDLDDEFDREYLFKRYVAVSSEDYAKLSLMSGIPRREVLRASRTFRRDEARAADTGAESTG